MPDPLVTKLGHAARPGCLLLLTALVGCSYDAPELKSESDQMLEQRQRYLEDFRREQVEVQKKGARFRAERFPGHGTVIIERVALLGLPRKEYLLVRFTYVNSTGETIEKARISVTLRNSGGEPASTEWLELSFPFGFPFTTGSSYTDEIHVPTNGVHREVGWNWIVNCIAFRPKPSDR